MCVSVYTCVHVWCVCVRAYACAGMCVYVCARVFVYVVSGVCVSLCVYVCVYVHVCVCTCGGGIPWKSRVSRKEFLSTGTVLASVAGWALAGVSVLSRLWGRQEQ